MQAPSGNPKPLTRTELDAWRGLLRAHSALVRDLDAELQAVHDLSLHEYEVLLVLSDAPECSMRMSDLAAAVLLSQSGLTRLVDRLVLAGLVDRARSLDDRRSLHAALTVEGRARFRQARVTHLAGVRSRFLDRFDEGELDLLASFWERVHSGATAE